MIEQQSEPVFEVKELGSDKDWQALYEEFVDTCSPALYETFAYLKAVGASSCVIDRRYVDADYRDEYAAVYGTTFITHSNLCSRLQFFAGASAQIQTALDGNGEIPAEHLGFVVIRPPEVGKVGRTLLKPPGGLRDGHHCYPVCTGSVPVHLRSQRFTIKGAPYISQDSMVVKCAQCAIWVATMLMSPELGHRHAFPYEITSAALLEMGWYGRPIPSTGLVVQQMVNALVKLGYNPVFLHKSQTHGWDPCRMIYPYVESGIPVIALVPEHAFTIVGHLSEWDDSCSFASDQWIRDDVGTTYPSIKCLSSHTWVSGFLIQDDNIGPYSVLPCDSARLSGYSGTWWERFLATTRYRNIGSHPITDLASSIEGIIVPQPGKVYLTAEDCITKATALLRALAGGGLVEHPDGYCAWRDNHPCFDALVKGLETTPDGESVGSPVVIRLYLERASRYKAGAAIRMKSLPTEILGRLLDTEMPRYVWVAELSVKDKFNTASSERQALAEILFDPTANPYAAHPWVVLHLPGFLIRQMRDRSFDLTTYAQFEPFLIHERSYNGID